MEMGGRWGGLGGVGWNVSKRQKTVLEQLKWEKKNKEFRSEHDTYISRSYWVLPPRISRKWRVGLGWKVILIWGYL